MLWVESADGVLFHVAAAQQPVALHWLKLGQWLGSLPQYLMAWSTITWRQRGAGLSEAGEASVCASRAIQAIHVIHADSQLNCHPISLVRLGTRM